MRRYAVSSADRGSRTPPPSKYEYTVETSILLSLPLNIRLSPLFINALEVQSDIRHYGIAWELQTVRGMPLVALSQFWP
jgi:hypothetical protein